MHLSRLTTLLLLALTIISTACQTNYAELPTYSGARQLQAVIETPAGSGHHVQYNTQAKSFESSGHRGQSDGIPYLPYPANYGFIPSTEVGADGRGLSTMVLTGSRETGTVLEVVPIATLMLEKPTGDLYPVIISVPARPSERTIPVTDYKSLSSQYPGVKSILQQWFVQHDPGRQLKFIGWKDEQFAEKEIRRWMKL